MAKNRIFIIKRILETLLRYIKKCPEWIFKNDYWYNINKLNFCFEKTRLMGHIDSSPWRRSPGH